MELLRGLLLLVITGICWVPIGAVIGGSAKRGFPVGAVQGLSALLVGIGSGIFCVLRTMPDASSATWLWVLGAQFLAGALNYFTLLVMGRAMRSGPNGVVWATMQSALIFPFFFGILVYGVALSAFRIVGVAGIIAGLFCFACAKNPTSDPSPKAVKQGSAWRSWMFFGFLLAGVTQIMANMASYRPETVAVGSVYRLCAMQGGTLAAFLISGIWGQAGKALWQARKAGTFYGMAIVLSLINGVCGFLFFYPGLDALAAAGAGAIGYPVIVGSCIVGFTIYSILILRERFTWGQLAGVLGCCVGVVGISL